VPLGDLLHFQNGVNADKASYGRGIPFANVLEVITHTHLHAGLIPGQVLLRRNQVDGYSVRPGDILFNRTSETQNEIGLASVYVGIEPIVFGGFVIRGRPRANDLDRVYSAWGLRAPAVRKQIVARGQGAIRANIGQADLRTVLVPLPPVGEQHAIAGTLTDADAVIESLKLLIAKKRAIKQGAMQELLTGRRRLAGFNGTWVRKSFGELFTISGGLSASRDQLSADGHYYLHYGDIHTSKSSYIDLASAVTLPRLNVPLSKVRKKSLLQEGDIVFVDASEDEDGASKHVVIFNPDKLPFISGLHTIVAKSRSDELDSKFKRYCFQSAQVRGQFRYYAVGTKVLGVSKTNIAKIELAFPELNEQVAIANILCNMDAEIEGLVAKLGKACQVKQGMMQELLTGRVRLA
jgi:type I restriction enzyme S subunit